MYRVTKREGNLESFDISRIENAIRKAFMSCETEVSKDVITNIAKAVNIWDTISIEDIQDQIIELLGDYDYPDVAAAIDLIRISSQEPECSGGKSIIWMNT